MRKRNKLAIGIGLALGCALATAFIADTAQLEYDEQITRRQTDGEPVRPASPHQIDRSKVYLPALHRGSLELDDSLTAIVADGNWIYVAGHRQIFVVDASRPEAPIVVGDIVYQDLWWMSSPVDLALSESHLFLLRATAPGDLSWETQVLVFDRTQATRPRLIGQVEFPKMAFDIEVHGSWIYAGVFNYREDFDPLPTELLVIDVRDPTQPRLHDTLDLDIVTLDMKIDGDRLYLAGFRDPPGQSPGPDERIGSLRTLNLDVPDAPALGPGLDRPNGPNDSKGPIRSIAVTDGLVYVSDLRGLWLADLRVEREPRWAAEIALEQEDPCDLRLVLAGQYLVAQRCRQILILDPLEPPTPSASIPRLDPTPVGHIEHPYALNEFDIGNDLVATDERVQFIDVNCRPKSLPRGASPTDCDDGVTQIDISDPQRPRLLPRLN